MISCFELCLPQLEGVKLAGRLGKLTLYILRPFLGHRECRALLIALEACAYKADGGRLSKPSSFAWPAAVLCDFSLSGARDLKSVAPRFGR